MATTRLFCGQVFSRLLWTLQTRFFCYCSVGTSQMFVLLFKSTDNYLYLKTSSLFAIVGFYSQANEVGFLHWIKKLKLKISQIKAIRHDGNCHPLAVFAFFVLFAQLIVTHCSSWSICTYFLARRYS